MTDSVAAHERLGRGAAALLILGRLLFLAFILLPFMEMLFVSLKSLAEAKTIPYRLLPSEIRWENYRRIWETVPQLGRYIANSLFLGVSVTLLNLTLALPASYGFSRFDFRHKELAQVLLLSCSMISGVLLLIPLYRIFSQAGLLNTYIPMILVGGVSLLPVNIWLLRSYLAQIPRELDEAAHCDGANVFQILTRIVTPALLPSLVVLGTRTFIAAYAQQFAFALTFNRRTELMPITQGLYAFFGRQDVIWNQLMSASITACLPVILLFLFMQKYIIEGLSGSIKG